MSTDRATDAEILGELVELAHLNPSLAQFRSLVGAHQYLRLYRTIRRHVPVGAEVLDWGAGNGHFSFFLSRAGYRATGYSFEPPMFLEWLRDPAYRYAPGIEADPVTIPFDDESFDVVVSVGVLEHVRETGGNEPASLSEVARVLRPGGKFVCYHLPNRHSLVDFVARQLPRAHRHEYRYTRRDIEELARGADLDLVELQRYAILPRNPAYLLPEPARASRRLAATWDALDAVLGAAVSALCTNYLFVARKPAPPGGSTAGKS